MSPTLADTFQPYFIAQPLDSACYFSTQVPLSNRRPVVTTQDIEPPSVIACPSSNITVTPARNASHVLVTWLRPVFADNALVKRVDVSDDGVVEVDDVTDGMVVAVTTSRLQVVYTATDSAELQNACS